LCIADHIKPLNRAKLFLLPPSIQDWLPEKHLARFVVDIAAKLDMSAIPERYDVERQLPLPIPAHVVTRPDAGGRERE